MRLRQVLAVGPLPFKEIGHRIDAKTIDPDVEPVTQHVEHLFLNSRAIVVEVRLVMEEAVPVVRSAFWIPRPV